MQMNDKVLTALEVLKDCAENEFELHRIEVLIRDLTEPPKVEQIDETHQRFNGIVYKANAQGHYVNFNFIHRAIWQYYYGDIPTDDVYEIHHSNENKSDNNISNLRLLTKAEHHRIHMETAPLRKHVCENCGKVFYSTSIKGNVRCCSKGCIQDLHYNKKHEQRKCAFCGKTFSVYKYSKTICCSQICAKKLYHQSAEKIEKVCPICGKTFYSEVHNKLFCSKECINENRRRKKKLKKAKQS